MLPHTSSDNSRTSWSTQRIAIYALFTALAMMLSFIEIPLFPAAPYLKYDPSGIVVLLAGFAYGYEAAILVSILSWLPHLFTNPFGAIISIVCLLALSVPSAWIYSKNRTRQGALISMVVGAVAFILCALGLNLIITPLYSAVSLQTVIAMIVPILLPFNVIKVVLHLVITTVIYKPTTAVLKAFDKSQESARRIS